MRVFQRPDDTNTLFILAGWGEVPDDVYYTLFYSPHNSSITFVYNGDDKVRPDNFDKFVQDCGEYAWLVTTGRISWERMKPLLEDSLERHNVR